MVFERLAERLQKATNHKYAWFGRFWISCLFVEVLCVVLTSEPLSLTTIGRFVLMNTDAWHLVLGLGISCGTVGIISFLFDEELPSLNRQKQD